MSDVFGQVYSNVYDILYQDKDYAAECDLLERIFKQYGCTPIKTILDLGCGTGNHAIPLAERGFEVTGVDCSQEMINVARDKANSKNISAKFYLGDIRQLSLNTKFDAVLMMFAVLGYQLENADVLAALKSARSHINAGGLLILDVWYGPAVIAQRPTDRVKAITISNKKILRAASGELDTLHHYCTVRYNLWQLHSDNLVAEVKEEHCMRFFFPKELELFLKMARFNLLRLGIFEEVDKDPDESTWNVMAITKASDS